MNKPQINRSIDLCIGKSYFNGKDTLTYDPPHGLQMEFRAIHFFVLRAQLVVYELKKTKKT